jgi:AcrR family transcriptional regulator
MNSSDEVKRTYDSSRRREKARATRLAIIEAAGELFAEHGYVATSVDAIAEAAGVSRATVFSAVGGKAVLLKEAYDVAFVGDDAPVPLAARPHALAILAEPDPAVLLASYAEMIAEIFARISGIYEAIRAAAPADPAIARMWERINEERYGGAGKAARAMKERGALREDLDVRAATDVMWVLNDPGLYRILVVQRRWSRRRYETWLAGAMQLQLLRSGR